LIVKLLELRDRATNISVAAIKFDPKEKREKAILNHSGFLPNDFVFLIQLHDPLEMQYDPWEWGSRRTMGSAHKWLADHFDEVKSGDLIDVEVILGEKKEPVKSEYSGC